MQPPALPLRDIHLPDAISWWPPAMGWWLLLILLPLVVVAIWWSYKKFTRVTAIKRAQKILTLIQHDQQSDDLQKLQQLSTWLRRVAITQTDRQQSASLTGTAWLKYLDNSIDGSPFSQGIGHIFADAQFRRSAPEDIDISALIILCGSWLKGQKQ